MSQKILYSNFIKNSHFLEVEELESLQSSDLEIETLKRPVYSCRVPIDNKLQVLSNSLTANGFIGKILVSKNTFSVIDGWQRLELWKALGHKEISAYLIECSIERELQLHLSFNQQASEFDLSKFGLTFKQIELSDFGFSEIEMQNCREEMRNIEKDLNDSFDYPRPERIKKPQIYSTVSTILKITKIKEKKKLKTQNEVVNFLIDFYESH